ncbi:MAG: DUF58 domain-containing protein [Spirochaetaceae bacterium]
MTGLAVLVVLALLFVPFAPVQWGAAFLLFLTGTSRLYAEILRLNLSVERGNPEIRMFRHEDSEAVLIVHNTGFLPAPMIVVSDGTGELYPRDEPAFVRGVPARARLRHRYRLRAHHRGVYPLGPIRLRTADPLGLFPQTREIRSFGRVVVYPRHDRISLPRRLGVPAGALAVSTPIAADTTRYRSLRDYVPGDDTRHIGWKATARHGSLKTREFTPTLDMPMLVFVNLRAADYLARHRVLAVERAVETAAGIVTAAARAAQRFRLYVHGEGGEGDAMTAAGGPGAVLEALELLARARPSDAAGPVATALAHAWARGRAERVFYVGAVLGEETVQQILRVGVRPGTLELFYVQELGRPAVPRALHGLAVHPVRLFGDHDGHTAT